PAPTAPAATAPAGPAPRPAGSTPWWQDPLGDTLTGVGIVGLGVGAYFLWSARTAEQRSREHHDVFLEEDDKAESHGRIGVIAAAAGGALLVGGIIRYLARSDGASADPPVEGTTLSGWMSAGGGGLAASGRF
ncbi:MAG: hypothetical protein M3680_30650, partial [Myxococcota bacterium]|nr:hypothetical protein [Myxococcota bacterium]